MNIISTIQWRIPSSAVCITNLEHGGAVVTTASYQRSITAVASQSAIYESANTAGKTTSSTRAGTYTQPMHPLTGVKIESYSGSQPVSSSSTLWWSNKMQTNSSSVGATVVYQAASKIQSGTTATYYSPTNCVTCRR